VTTKFLTGVFRAYRWHAALQKMSFIARLNINSLSELTLADDA